MRSPREVPKLYAWVCPNCGKQYRGPGGHHVAGDDRATSCKGQPRLERVEVVSLSEERVERALYSFVLKEGEINGWSREECLARVDLWRDEVAAAVNAVLPPGSVVLDPEEAAMAARSVEVRMMGGGFDIGQKGDHGRLLAKLSRQ